MSLHTVSLWDVSVGGSSALDKIDAGDFEETVRVLEQSVRVLVQSQQVTRIG